MTAPASGHGSAPRVRGTGAAGPATDPVQPRVCGERPGHVDNAADGSAPRVRGTDSGARYRRRKTTVQPRVCGERSCGTTLLSAAVQPRVCGERSPCRAQEASIGSAPRVRGTGIAYTLRQDGSAPRVRGTDAHRGHTVTAKPVQPRVCGEQAVPGSTAPCAGSAPRVRGTDPSAASASRARFSPACAGNGICSQSLPRRGSAPRVRGTGPPHDERSTDTVQPRVCGERRAGHVLSRQDRFSPACAGNGWRPAAGG